MVKTKVNQELIDLANSQIYSILDKLGVSYSESGEWASGACKIHHGDNKKGFGYNVSKGYWNCFTRKCHEQYGSNIIGLVSGTLQLSYEDAVGWLQDNVEDVKIKRFKMEHKEDKIYPEVCLLRLFKTDFYLKKNFLQQTLDAFEHGSAQSGDMLHRVVFPIRDSNGFIRGFSGRWSGKEVDNPDGTTTCFTSNGKEVAKWRHTSFHKSQYLYNFYRAKEFCSKELILVESIGNTMRWWEAGFRNCVACLGSSLSTIQAQMIMASTKKIILAFDQDPAGRLAAEKTKAKLEEFIDLVDLIPTKNDWAKMSNQEVKDEFAKNICKSN